jgi:hypothetical protein
VHRDHKRDLGQIWNKLDKKPAEWGLQLSSKRRGRIAALIASWRSFLPRVVDGLPESNSNASSNVAHHKAKSFLLREAQRRWSVSFSTAREYAHSAYLAIAQELEEELRRRRSGINLACGIQPRQSRTYARENSEWVISLANSHERSPWQGCLPALLLMITFPSSIRH